MELTAIIFSLKYVFYILKKTHENTSTQYKVSTTRNCHRPYDLNTAHYVPN